ncbi:ATP-binding cassette domain-containing protein [Alphaproteobacteria bacterium KMM 3653]|uniref:ATP-binding cassette domain-containing protein n=1 Tax=Harenicola maris TaxID=2841044 RepID=A0AAP2CQG4_9RHOB|nr:ATP-binding cassette domain-containing protein [Harenicola maris]
MNILRIRRGRTKPSAPAAPLPQGHDEVITMSDRAAPGWARGLSYAFALGSGGCVLAVAVMAVFFQSLVVTEFQGRLAPIFVAVGLVPLTGIMLFEYAHSRALAGYRQARRAFFLRGQAALALVVMLVLGMVHPLLALPIALSAILAYLGQTYLARRKTIEPYWDFSRQEAVSVLAGRDAIGRRLATRVPEFHSLSHALNRIAGWLSILLALGTGSYLAAQEVLGLPAVAAITLISFWAAEAIARHLTTRAMTPPMEAGLAGTVTRIPPIEDEDFMLESGLNVRALTVSNAFQQNLLSDVTFTLERGTVTGVLGDSGGGKSLLLQSIIDPFGLPGLEVRGDVRLATQDLWERQTRDHPVPAVYLAPQPSALPATGHENLTCFGRITDGMRAEKALEKLVFSADTVRSICAAPDASTLPGMQQKALAYARAFLLTPSLYLLDRPEDALPEKQISALISLLKQEVRLGRSVVMVTEHRALLELCDKHIVLQEGRINDLGDATEIRNRLSSGWSRLVAVRQLEAEDNLERWVRSHFKRDGDESNRRKVCTIASEMLAFSCQSADANANQTVAFEFKHFEGYCLIKLIDSDPAIGTALLQKASKIASSEDHTGRLPPLAALIASSLDVEAGTSMDRRTLTVKIETYDPRKKSAKPNKKPRPNNGKAKPKPKNDPDKAELTENGELSTAKEKRQSEHRAKQRAARAAKAQAAKEKAQDAN